MRWRTSSSARRSDSPENRSASASERPIVLPSMIPETDSDSWTMLDMSAIVSWRVVVILLRWAPTRRVSATKKGSRPSENTARRQSRTNIAMTLARTVVAFATIDVAVDVTTVWTPPMSLAIRACTSPVRVLVKNASERRWRWR